MSKAMVLFSGGLDSTVVAHYAIHQKKKENVILLNMYYGQRHTIEIECARSTAARLGCTLIEKDISSVFDSMNCALLAGNEMSIKDTSYEEQIKESETGIVNTYVPFRNGIFLSIAAAIAYNEGCEAVYIGVHADDSGTAYPDCSSKFIDSMLDSIRYGTGDKVYVVAPFVDRTKTEVVRCGLDLGMTQEDFDNTHSCYKGIPGGCGVCSTCRDRDKALLANGLKIPNR